MKNSIVIQYNKIVKKKANVFKGNNIASQIGVRLEGNFIRKM